jgi:uncharacterized membrane-anchored protein
MGDTPGAIEHLRAALAGFDERHMSLFASSARLALARLVGGDEAAALERAARAVFEAQGVEAPERYAAHYAPGFGLKN